MKILFVNSGGLVFETRYAFGIFDTLENDFLCTVQEVNPFHLSRNIIDDLKPDVLLVIHGTFTPLELVHFAKFKGATTALWLVEDPYEIDCHRGPMVESYDYVFTTEKQAVHEYHHPRVFYLPWCCHPRVHKQETPPPAYHSDLCLVGVAFPNRVRLLNAIVPVIKDLNVKLIGNWGDELVPELRRFIIPVISDFWEVQKYYNGAKINLNIHRNPVDPPSGNSKAVPGISPNDRTFALAGSGAFQLVDPTRPDLWECFTKDYELVEFNNPDDLSAKILHYLSKSDLRSSIAGAAQQRAYNQHTFYHRLDQMFRIMKLDLPRKFNSL
jgi:spore maturation protein CgeB